MFRLAHGSDASVVSGGGFFSWGSKFKYVGRTEREILQSANENSSRSSNGTASGSESSGLRRKASSVPATPSTPMNSDFGIYTDDINVLKIMCFIL